MNTFFHKKCVYVDIIEPDYLFVLHLLYQGGHLHIAGPFIYIFPADTCETDNLSLLGDKGQREMTPLLTSRDWLR